ncbi:hypothetical protein KSP39_PZI003709 [Platanthera zijinensis]|uniref:Photosystem II core complex proteins psbY, chloroplastic n=1 Tax=Platanthera zijinensis TaxID=2320716 RepID=A0AAP0BTZ8_9ASPA
MLLAKCSTTTTPPKLSAAAVPRTSVPKGLAASAQPPSFLSPLTSAAIASAVFSSLGSADTAFAVQQIADIAEGDSRGLALLIPIVPALGWVLYNILQPALNQINRMRSNGLVVGLGLGFWQFCLMSAPDASASELATIGAAVSEDNRGLLLLAPVGVAIAWVLFNILQPALNQINKMRSG